MRTFSAAVFAAGISCFTILILRLFLPGRGGLGSLFKPGSEQEEGSALGGVFFLPGIVAGMLAGGGSLSGNALFALLITAAAILVGFINDLVALQDKRGEGIVPWLRWLLVFLLALSAAIYLSFLNESGRRQFLPVSCVSSDLKGWLLIPALVLLLGRFFSEQELHEASGPSFCAEGAEAVFWCFVFCLAGETGALEWAAYRSEFSGMAVFCGAVSGALLGICIFNPYGKMLRPGTGGYLGIAAALSLMALCSGWLILLPLAALWPFCCLIFALVMRVRVRGKAPAAPDRFFLTAFLTGHGMTKDRLQSTVRWLSLLGVLAAAVLYTL